MSSLSQSISVWLDPYWPRLVPTNRVENHTEAGAAYGAMAWRPTLLRGCYWPTGPTATSLASLAPCHRGGEGGRGS